MLHAFNRSTYFVDYFKKKLDAVAQSLSDLECNSKHSDKDYMDLKTTKNALDQQKVNMPRITHRFIIVLPNLFWYQLFIMCYLDASVILLSLSILKKQLSRS